MITEMCSLRSFFSSHTHICKMHLHAAEHNSFIFTVVYYSTDYSYYYLFILLLLGIWVCFQILVTLRHGAINIAVDRSSAGYLGVKLLDQGHVNHQFQ